MSERANEQAERERVSGACEQSEQGGASERVSGASERANGRASGPVLQSVFLAVIDHSVTIALTSVPPSSFFFSFSTSCHKASEVYVNLGGILSPQISILVQVSDVK